MLNVEIIVYTCEDEAVTKVYAGNRCGGYSNEIIGRETDKEKILEALLIPIRNQLRRKIDKAEIKEQGIKYILED
jgi:hypothetical protein